MPARQIETEIDINATPAAVWAVLSDGASYPSWNSFLVQLDGELKQGQRIKIQAKPPGQTGGTFTPILLAVEPAKELRWRGSLPIPGLFVGEHYFLLSANGSGGSRLVHGEKFNGLLLPFLGGLLKATETGFNNMNRELKGRVEGGNQQ